MIMNLPTPLNGCVLVELTENYQYVVTPDKQYATKTSGIVKAIAPELESFLLNSKVYFDEYKDGTQIKVDDKTYAFIKYEEIRGYDGKTE